MSSKRKLRYSLTVFFWILISTHLGYQYFTYSSSQVGSDSKKGTFVEAITDEVGYLPYISTSDSDKFYQSLLFKNCSLPILDEAIIEYRDNACIVQTQDYQTYTIQIHDDAGQWSDGTPVNLNDILFTYKTIIVDNYWELASLNGLNGIIISPDSSANQITITFPEASVDNNIFFTNFILPSHVLANQTLETYIEEFGAQPITSGCAQLQPSLTDPTSTVFDLLDCENTNLRYYQVKAFSSLDDILSYIPTGSLTIDMSTEPFEYSGYEQHKILINKIQSFFFNTTSESFPTSRRKAVGDLFTSIFATTDTQDYLIKDPYLFDQYDSVTLSNTGTISTIREALSTTNTEQVQVATLPSEIVWNDESRNQTFQILNAIEDKFQILFRFEEGFDRVSVSHDGGPEYFPASFSPENNTTFYNLNPLFNNVRAGVNTYTIRGYRPDGTISTYQLTVSYLQEYTTDQEVATLEPLRVISFNDTTSVNLINELKQSLMILGLQEFFVFQSFDERNEYEGKLTSRDYDIVLRTINLGLRKDISTLFTQDDPLVNPSLWSDQEFAQQMNRYFRVDATEQATIKNFIDERFSEQYPVMIVGKSVETITLRSDIENPFPFRLYVLGWRGQYLPNLEVFNHISLDWDRIKDPQNAIQFITDAMKGSTNSGSVVQ